jgi:hypothetical protein
MPGMNPVAKIHVNDEVASYSSRQDNGSNTGNDSNTSNDIKDI